MKPEQIYQELKDLAEKLGITVSEQNFRKTGIKAKSGLCMVREKFFFHYGQARIYSSENRIAVRLPQ